ncbi:Oidioi.mRNA.OKI2018_I69.PAR.g9801.t1.cds [Oikopleura dioica]|uniref:Oidioi.mRNA.OKI2018_I69.PAR.g9801.t1.cds n=1 Tax=Oikopleura dioica TaxID=34765 RepID=A0ABN7RQX5_OIKDI|nr:Oidioi.mRNA.OKI2018_I69.PAR.g9801.t1.cds [Oikopleura dioica]
MEEDSWVEDAKLPNPIAKPSVLVINNRIICVGGIINSHDPSDRVEVFDGEKWTTQSLLPEGLMGIAAVNISENEGIIMGGMASGKTKRISMNSSRYDLHVTLYGQNVFAVGGRCGKQPVAAVESFDIELNQWTSWMNLPSPTALSSFGCSRGMMVIAGGLKVSQANHDGFCKKVSFLDITKKASISDWTGQRRWSLLQPRGSCQTCSIDGWFINLGGINNEGKPADQVETINLREPANRFQPLPNLPYPIACATTLLTKDAFYFLGGISSFGPTTSCLKVYFERDPNCILFDDLANKTPTGVDA